MICSLVGRSVSNGSWALENIKIKQKRLESAKLVSNSDQMLLFLFRIFYTYTYALKRVCSTKLTLET